MTCGRGWLAVGRGETTDAARAPGDHERVRFSGFGVDAVGAPR